MHLQSVRQCVLAAYRPGPPCNPVAAVADLARARSRRRGTSTRVQLCRGVAQDLASAIDAAGLVAQSLDRPAAPRARLDGLLVELYAAVREFRAQLTLAEIPYV